MFLSTFLIKLWKLWVCVTTYSVKIVEASSVLHRKNILLFVIMRSEAQTLFESMTDEEMCTAAESILFFCITIFWETWMPSFFHSSNYKSLKFAITVFMRCRNSKVWFTASRASNKCSRRFNYHGGLKDTINTLC